LKVVEIFDSIDGEGVRTGQPCSFVRLAGCNIRCSYCDTTYALFGENEPCEYTEMTVDEIVSHLNTRYKRVTLTGGEPLIHANIKELTKKLLSDGYEVNIETNGAVDITEFLKDMPRTKKLFLTIDYKLPSSGMSDRMIWRNFVNLREFDAVKFVVGSDEDMRVMKSVTEKMQEECEVMPMMYAGVVYGKYEPIRLVETILNEPIMKDFKYQIQLHKLIWDPEKRGV
jgi:7-carboxy-7-deazaguanine synthase